MAGAVASHILATMRLMAASTSQYPGEIAMNGWHIGTVGAASTVPGYNDGTIDLNLFTANSAATTSTTTHLNKTQGWAGDSGASGGNVTDGDQDGIAEAIFTYWTTVKARVPSVYGLESIRLYPVDGTTGRAVQAPCIYEPTAASNGDSTSAWLPQLAIVTSYDTNARGRVGHGKTYLGPVDTNAVTNQGLLNADTNAVVGGAAATLSNDIRAIGSIASERYYLMVWRRHTLTGSVVGGIRVGDEFDTQQRRRRQRPESYLSYSLA